MKSKLIELNSNINMKPELAVVEHLNSVGENWSQRDIVTLSLETLPSFGTKTCSSMC